MKHFYFVLGMLLLLAQAQAEGPDDQYVRIYNLIQNADTLESNGQPTQALAKYLDAQAGLQRFRKAYPDWNPKVIQFRFSYLAGKVALLSAKVPAPSPGVASPEVPAAPAPPQARPPTPALLHLYPIGSPKRPPFKHRPASCKPINCCSKPS